MGCTCRWHQVETTPTADAIESDEDTEEDDADEVAVAEPWSVAVNWWYRHFHSNFGRIQ